LGKQHTKYKDAFHLGGLLVDSIKCFLSELETFSFLAIRSCRRKIIPLMFAWL